MTYSRAYAELGGCGCGGGGAMGCSGLGATDPSTVGAIGAPAGVDPVVYLKAQLNRYTQSGGAPINFQIAPAPLAVTSSIDADTASRSLFVLGRRAGAANMSAPDAATKALLQSIGTAWANPTSYVQRNLPAVIDIVRLYADANSLPPPKGVPVIENVSVATITPAMIGVGALVLAAIVWGGSKKRRSSR